MHASNPVGRDGAVILAKAVALTQPPTSSQLEHKPALVFEASRLGALSRRLRQEGRRWVFDVLDRHDDTPVAALFAEDLPVGPAYRLGAGTFKGPLKRIGPWRQLRGRRLIKRAVAGKTPLKTWLRFHQQQLERGLCGFSELSLPDAIWPYAGHIAWREPHFQLALADDLNRWLCRRYLFDGDATPFPHFHPNTFWTLFYLGALQRPRFFPSREWRRSAALATLARREILQPDWAGFWDQWLLCHALLHFQAELKRDVLLAGLLRDLPTARWWALVPEPPRRRRLSGLRRFFARRRHGRRGVPAASGRGFRALGNDGEDLLHLAAPHWSDAVPTTWLSLLTPLSVAVTAVTTLPELGADPYV